MTQEIYEITEMEAGWFFVLNGTKTGPFNTESEAIKAAEREVLFDNLDTGLEDTFPASDPVSATFPGNRD